MAKRRYRALLVGNSHFPQDPDLLPDLRGPLNDLSQMAAVLSNEEIGVFEPDDVQVLMERESPEISDALRDLCEDASVNDVLFLYYSGHGLPGDSSTGSLLLCGRDTSVATAASTAVSFREIKEALQFCAAAAVIIVLDCCNSGAAKASLDTAELAGRGRYILAATRSASTARDATSVRGLSLFTEHLVAGLWGRAARPDSVKITVKDLYDYTYGQMVPDGQSIPTFKFDGYGDVAIGHAPEVQDELADGPRRRVVPSAPTLARALGRWSLAAVLLILVDAGSRAFVAAATELAYRAQWEISGFVEHESSSLGWGEAFRGVFLLVLGAGLGIFVCSALLSRILGVAWWLPPALLAVLAAGSMFEGLNFYGDNHSSLFVAAAAMVLCRYLLPRDGRPSGRRIRMVVVGTAAVWLPCAYLGYHFGGYQSSAWGGADAQTFATLKGALAIDRTLSVWLAGTVGFALGGLVVYWLWARVPVLGRRTRWLRWTTRPWVRGSVSAAVLIAVIPTSVILATIDYRGRIDYGFTQPDLHAFASPWFGYLDACDDTDCVMHYWDAGAPDIEIYFAHVLSHDDALDSVRTFGARDHQDAEKADFQGYTYWIGAYDGHDGEIYWTYTTCSCWGVIRVHNSQPEYEFATSIFHDITDVPVSQT